MRATASRKRGTAMVEAAMWIPIMTALFYGVIELGRLAYTYTTLEKVLTQIARDVGTRQSLDFCNDTTTAIDDAKNFALRGDIDAASDPVLPNLTADQIDVSFESVDTDGTLNAFQPECGGVAGGPPPSYVVVSIPDGYSIRLTFPTLLLDPIPLRPQVRVPFGGTT